MPPPPASPAGADGAPAIDGPGLARALFAAERSLVLQRDALNAINVFPVPDGDTGTNMSLTMRAACDAIRDIESQGASVGAVAMMAAHAALMGARGNSGVILSQILTGFAAFEDPAAPLDGRALADALERGRAAAYRVISSPREGTILTAITAAARAGGAASANAPAVQVLAAAAAAAQEATDRTPELLPVLKEAGVVDAGAQGLAFMLDAMARSLRGEELPAARGLGAIDASWLAATRALHDAGDRSGFCTEFVVTAPAIDTDAVRARLSSMGDSLLVVGDGDTVRVHLHTGSPEDAFAYARTLGAVSHEKAEDMEAQFQSLAARPPGPPEAKTGLAVVAVAAGPGMEALFRSLGASGVVHGGQTMNPSAGEIRDAVVAAGGANTIVLPNNKNIVLAAQQAARDLGEHVYVVATRSIPQGVAAMVAFNAEATAADNVAAMEAAIAAVHTGEVTLAARPTKIHGLDVRQGQPIALSDGDLALAAETLSDAAYECAARMLGERSGAIVTLYYGEGESAAAAEAVAERLRSDFECEAEIVDGGQPHYPYLIGVE
ncbi:MAG: DAK2 domain-containing protein [Chloroflexi bacterium]|nr:DAK2 domain-containing protein [Chloroflexota bacterium]